LISRLSFAPLRLCVSFLLSLLFVSFAVPLVG
jgi:hypothetical protein